MDAPFAVTPSLTGSSVALVPLGPDHVEGMIELNADAEVGRLTGTHASFDRVAIEAWCASRAAATDRLDFAVLALAVPDRDGAAPEFVGDLAVIDLDVDNQSCSFRVALLERAAGRGLGTEAVLLMVDHVFSVGIHRISLEVYGHNPRARRAYERCGFVHEGTLRDALLWEGERIDAHVMARLDTDPSPT